MSTTSGLYIASIMAVSGSRNKQLFLMQTPLGGSHIQCAKYIGREEIMNIVWVLSVLFVGILPGSCAKNIVLCLWYIQLVDYCPQVYVPEIVTLCGINRKFLCEYSNCIVYQPF